LCIGLVSRLAHAWTALFYCRLLFCASDGQRCHLTHTCTHTYILTHASYCLSEDITLRTYEHTCFVIQPRTLCRISRPDWRQCESPYKRGHGNTCVQSSVRHISNIITRTCHTHKHNLHCRTSFIINARTVVGKHTHTEDKAHAH
jgi:hypothetical protein